MPLRPRHRLVTAVTAVCGSMLVLGACGASTTATTDSAGTTPGSAAGPTGAPSSAPAATVAPATTAPDPGTLPQTDQEPSESGPQWDADTRALWQAIVDDDPDQARSFFFPLGAYQQVKAISDPAGDYDKRLIAYYEDDIHKLHKQLGADAATAQFARLEVPPTAQWIKPGVEYNKGAYWRVLDSKLVYTVAGKEKSFVVKSMISWRGEWYVVHLSSIR